MSTPYVDEIAVSDRSAPTAASRTTLLENDEVLVVATTYPPGANVPIHAHRYPQVAYVIDGGTIQTIDADGTVEIFEMRPGETLWSAAAHAHGARNLGSTPVRIVEVELKHATPQVRVTAPHAMMPETLEWIADPLDPRRATALMVGDPTKPGPYTARFRAPAGYVIERHLHPHEDEQVTVLSGAIRWSAGEPGRELPEYVLTAGCFAFVPAGVPHRIVAVEDTVLQMSGIGPRIYVYLDPADDPRRPR